MKKITNNKYFLIALTLVIGGVLGWLIKPSNNQTEIPSNDHAVENKDQVYTCSMHPQIRSNEPGDCPICGMELIPLNHDTDEDADPMAISMSEAAMQLANVQTMVVSKEKPKKEVRMPGKVQADERLVYTQVSHIPGRIEQLKINYTGEVVRKGQTLAMLYSPELVTAQQELLEAAKIKDRQPMLFDAAKEKLRLWKISEKQIEQIATSNKIIERFPILADVSGTVMKKLVNTGDYLQRGMPLYEIADLSKVWVMFDVYESDMSWVKTGSTVEFTISSIPGEMFKGTVSFIDPVIDPMTRVARARVEMSNSTMKLKPEMFASGIIKSDLKNEKDAIVVPKSAVMWTGERSVVYVKNKTETGLSFIMREVILGPSLGDSYVINSGLVAGEEIAVNGTFSIDAAAQLAGKPSMMNPQGGVVMTGHDHQNKQQDSKGSETALIKTDGKVKSAIQPLLVQYFLIKDALVNDDAIKAKSHVATLQKNLSNVDMKVFTGASHTTWMKQSDALGKIIGRMILAGELDALRKDFIDLSVQFIGLAKSYGPFDMEIYVINCPMANENKGADWLSKSNVIMNPYFGSKMLKCGSVKDSITGH